MNHFLNTDIGPNSFIIDYLRTKILCWQVLWRLIIVLMFQWVLPRWLSDRHCSRQVTTSRDKVCHSRVFRCKLNHHDSSLHVSLVLVSLTQLHGNRNNVHMQPGKPQKLEVVLGFSELSWKIKFCRCFFSSVSKRHFKILNFIHWW